MTTARGDSPPFAPARDAIRVPRAGPVSNVISAGWLASALLPGPDDSESDLIGHTHGASIVGFAFAHMLGIHLLPRLKNVGSARLYRPAAGEDEKWPNLAPVLSTKTID
jgi:hypothetical protein